MGLKPVVLNNTTDAFTNEHRPAEVYSNTTRLRVEAGEPDRKYIYIYFSRPFPLGTHIVEAKMYLYAAAESSDWPAQSRTITASRILGSWKAGKLCWDNQPEITTSGQVAVNKTDSIQDGEAWEFNLTSMMQSVSDGMVWYGVRFHTNETTVRRFYGGSSPVFKPIFRVTWSEAPDQPATLSPSGGRAIATQYPTLRFDFTDRTGNVALQAVQAQLDNGNDFANVPDFDTGMIWSSTPEINLLYLMSTLLDNGTFDTNTTGWTAGPTTTIARVTNPVHAGAGSLRLTRGTGTGDVSAYYPSGSDYMSVTAYETYTAYAYMGMSTPRSAQIQIEWYTAGGTPISTSTSGSVTTSAISWTLVAFNGVTAPAGAAAARVRVKLLALAQAEVQYVDDVVLAGGSNGSFAGFQSSPNQTYWRCRVMDGSGQWSDWSASVSATYGSKGSLAITNPVVGGYVEEATPPITWTFTGQVARQVIITDTSGNWLYNSGKVTTALTSWTVPEGIIHDSTTYTVIVRVWDAIQREGVPGEPPYIEASRNFTYNLSGTVTPVTDLTATATSGSPGVALDFHRSSAPDSFTVIRDGMVIEANVDPVDIFVSGTAYQYIDRGATPRVTHAWQVRPVVNGVTASGNNTANGSSMTVGIWLWDPVDEVGVQLLGDDPGNWTMGEQAEIYTPLGASAPVRITQALRGYEGSINGRLVAYGSTTVASAEAVLFGMKSRPSRTYRLVLADLSIPVVIGNVVSAPTPTPEIERRVSFDFWQVENAPARMRL